MYKYKDILKALLEFYGNKEIIHTFSYYGDRMDSISFSAAQLIKSFHKIKKLTANVYIFELEIPEYIREYCTIIYKEQLISSFIIHGYSGFIEDEDNIHIYAYYPESYGDGIGEWCINKRNYTYIVKPFEIICSVYELNDDIKKSIEESMQVEDDDVLYKYHLGNYLRTLNPERLHREIK